MNDKPETVPCVICGEQTPYISTELCNKCWEISRRIRSNPVLLKKIVAYLKAEGIGVES